jgi:hypothetical protein
VDTALSDPVRDTRQAVDAAREAVVACYRFTVDLLDAAVDGIDHPQESVNLFREELQRYEASVRADERRETLARGDDATEARP